MRSSPAPPPAPADAPESSPDSGAHQQATAARSPQLVFTRHYAEMLVAMFLGMMVLGGVLGAVTPADLKDDAPALLLLAMAFNMSLPMVVWMRYRGHAWRLTYEMTAAMFIPAFAVIALLSTGAVTRFGTLMMILHVAMLASMLIAMLARREEYSHEHHRAPRGR